MSFYSGGNGWGVGLPAAALGAILSGCLLIGLLAYGGGGGSQGSEVTADAISQPTEQTAGQVESTMTVSATGNAIAAAAAYPAAGNSAGNSADNSLHSERREHVIELPEDGGQWSLTIVYATNDHSSPEDRRLRAAFWSSARLRSLVAQTNTTTYHPQDKLWQTKYRQEMGDTLPQVWLQDERGRLAYKASGANIPSYYPDQMADEMQLGVDLLVKAVRHANQTNQASGGQSFGHLAEPRGQNVARPQRYPYQAPGRSYTQPAAQPATQPARQPTQDCVGPNCPPYRPNTPAPQVPQTQPQPQPSTLWNAGRIPDIRPQLPVLHRSNNALMTVGIAMAAGVFVGLMLVLMKSMASSGSAGSAQPPQGQVPFGQYGPPGPGGHGPPPPQGPYGPMR